MRSLKVDGPCRVSTSSALSVAPTKAPSPPPRKDTISVVEERVGYGAFFCISYILLKTVSYIASFFPTDLTKPEELCKLFEKDPFVALQNILDLLNHSPDKAEEILVNFAKHWKANPDQFYPYSREENNAKKFENSKRNFIGKLDAILLELILSPEQREVMDKISDLETMEDFESGALCASSDWPSRKEAYSDKARELHEANNHTEARKYENAIRFREIRDEIEALKSSFNGEFGSKLLLKIIADEKFSDLMPLTKFTLADFFEKLIFLRKEQAANLLDDDTIKQWGDYLKTLLADLNKPQYKLEQFLRIKVLSEKLQLILSDKKKYERFRQIVLNMTCALLY